MVDLAADSECQDSDEQPFRQRAAEHHGAPVDLEHRQGLRQMMRHRLLITLLVEAVTGAGACRRTATETAGYKEEAPRPEEPLIRHLPEVGRYGGRYVLSHTSIP